MVRHVSAAAYAPGEAVGGVSLALLPVLLDDLGPQGAALHEGLPARRRHHYLLYGWGRNVRMVGNSWLSNDYSP